jgi:4-hydroxybenzoate polyprenyltransferase
MFKQGMLSNLQDMRMSSKTKKTANGQGNLLPPLFVRDSRVLVFSDLCWEALFFLFKQQPWTVLQSFFWLLRGRKFFLQQLIHRVEFSPQWLIYNQELVVWLREQQQAGRKLVLVTDFSKGWADAINQHLNLLFDEVVFCSRDRDAAAVELQKFIGIMKESSDRFVFAGTSGDLPVWQVAAGAVIVSRDPGLEEQVAAITALEMSIAVPRATLFDCVHAMRVYQWLKNCLIFVPLVASHRVGDLSSIVVSLAAFFAFSFCASAVYLINDLLDLPTDRKHDRKMKRPFAAGKLQLKTGAVLIPVLLLLSFGIALFLPGVFFLVLSGYFLMTLAYTFWLKQVVLVDVIILAGLYTLRIIAGSAATGIVLSFWLLSFSVFIFFSLALVKRYSELAGVLKKNEVTIRGRGYQGEDINALNNFGIASGYMSVLVLALYINSDNVSMLYSHSQLIWLLCPLLLYWVSRIWLIANRGEMHDDPLIFAIQDRTSFGVVALGLFILWLAV